MVHTYRNRKRNGMLLGNVVGRLFWLAIGLFVVGAFFLAWPLTLLWSVPLFLLWMSPAYADFFRRYYEIRLSDEGACEFRAALGRKHLRAQQIVSVQRDGDTARSEGDDAEHTVLRFQGGRRVVVVQPVDGFGDFLTRLEAFNPSVEVRGFEPTVAGQEDAWGHAGLPTVREFTKASPVFAALVFVFPLFTLGLLFQESRDNFWPFLFIPFMPAMWWLLIWLNIRGWINFDD